MRRVCSKWLEETVGEVEANGLKDLCEWVEIFTYISVILIAVNPVKSLPLYSSQDIDGEGQLLKVTDWYRLTPEDYDRMTFHVEVDVKGTSIEHLVNGADGKALSV